MTVPTVFRNRQERIISDFDFTDGVGFSGVIQYFPATASPDRDILTKTTMYSNEVVTSAGAVGTVGFETVHDLDFDVLVGGSPIIIKGMLIANVAIAARGGNSGSTGNKTRTTVTIRKWDGSTETDIASNLGTERSWENPAANTNLGGFMDLIEVEITTQTIIPSGEYLRINILVEQKNSTGTTIYSVGHDPKNRDGNDPDTSGFNQGDVTQSSFLVPFKLE